jgi:hypothetical protein
MGRSRAAPPAPKGPRLTVDLLERLGDVNGRVLATALAARDARIAELEARLKVIQQGLMQRAWRPSRSTSPRCRGLTAPAMRTKPPPCLSSSRPRAGATTMMCAGSRLGSKASSRPRLSGWPSAWPCGYNWPAGALSALPGYPVRQMNWVVPARSCSAAIVLKRNSSGSQGLSSATVS